MTKSALGRIHGSEFTATDQCSRTTRSPVEKSKDVRKTSYQTENINKKMEIIKFRIEKYNY